MANLRDGGLIIVGVSERENLWELTGILPEHLATYDHDEIADQVAKYTSPCAQLDVVLHRHDDGKQYLVFNIHQFSETPAICKRNGPDDLRSNERLCAGDFFIRPTGRARTEKVTDATHLHDLLELAAENRARRMLEVAHRVGLVPATSAEGHFEAELAEIDGMPVPVTEFSYWRVTIRPSTYSTELIPSRSACLKLIEKTTVRLQGWDFPFLSRHDGENCAGTNWIASWCEFMGSIEYWRLFQSGQFVYYGAVPEASEPGWREKLRNVTISHLRHIRDVKWDTVPGFILIGNMLYNITEYFEFAARIAQAGVYKGDVSVRIELCGVKGFVLTTEFQRLWRRYCVAHEDHLDHTWELASEKLIADSAQYSLAATAWFLESFGWFDPNLETLRKDQEAFLRKSR